MARFCVCIRLNGDFIKTIPSLWKNFPCQLEIFSLGKTIMFILSTGTIAYFLFMRYNNINIWNDVWDYNKVWSIIVLYSITAKDLKFSILSLSLIQKISILLLLNKKDKHTTSFVFSKMNSININKNIDKTKNVSKCIAKLCK